MHKWCWSLRKLKIRQHGGLLRLGSSSLSFKDGNFWKKPEGEKQDKEKRPPEFPVRPLPDYFNDFGPSNIFFSFF